MLDDHQTIGEALVASMLGARAEAVFAAVDLDAALAHRAPGGGVSRICFAAALNAVLFDDILVRVPTGAAFVADQRARGERIRFDHGALRTVRFPTGGTGALPAGQDAFARILGPLGYQVAGTYPLPRLKMTGRAWAQLDMPEELPQFFVSELHVERFDPAFAMAAQRVFHASRDPLDAMAKTVLAGFERDGEVPFDAAAAALPVIVAAFDRQHPVPALDDYALLLDRSDEAAWIATEGNAFNHATSRVPDVAAEADRQRAAGLPIKDRVEVSQTGRVRQTAFRADLVVRAFRDGDGLVERAVPGSFYEIIARDIDPATGRLDLSFDSGNATGIFAMTRAA
nr:DUF1338 family protein [Sphingomonas sp. Y57]